MSHLSRKKSSRKKGLSYESLEPRQMLANIGMLGSGIAVDDAATGTGFLMFSDQNVHQRFMGQMPEAGNSDNLIAVRHNGTYWQYNNNFDWIGFIPQSTDRLLATADFDTGAVGSLEGQIGSVEGIATGYASGDLAYVGNSWNGMENQGEFEVTGTMFEPGDHPMGVGELGRGVAVQDDATGAGYLMYSSMNVHHRFKDVYANNADHFLAVRFNGMDWQYNNNNEWVGFEPHSSDRLMGILDFDVDSSSLYHGSFGGIIEGIQWGFTGGDLSVADNQWNGMPNVGDYQITGSYFVARHAASVGPLNGGIAVDDTATGTGYIMHSQESVHSRFAGIISDNADNLIAVRDNGGVWEYNDNSSWVPFTPAQGDRLLATLDFDADSVMRIPGGTGDIMGIAAGDYTTSLFYFPNLFNGMVNTGEFTVSGEFFSTVLDPTPTPVDSMPVGALNKGVAVADSATGFGYLLYSEESVHLRLPGVLNPGNADHFIAVRYNSSGWEFNDNVNWNAFTPRSTDRLMAQVNFASNRVNVLGHDAGGFKGIAVGFSGGDFGIVPNSWDGMTNTDEFEIIGSHFYAQPLAGVGHVNSGVAVHDAATGTGYMLFSETDVQTRFGAMNANSDHFVAVRHDGMNWQFSDNTGWVNFAPRFGDRLVAMLDFTANTTMELVGQSGVFEGVAMGYEGGDLRFEAEVWNGVFNKGEFGVTGNFFMSDTISESVGELNLGIAVVDNALGQGFLMYSRTDVQSRFSEQPPLAGSSSNFVAVRNNGQGWQYNDNQSWNFFTPQDGDRLMAEIDYANDTITSYEGLNRMFDGVDLGFIESDLDFFADRWNGMQNGGEFEVTGTYFRA